MVLKLITRFAPSPTGILHIGNLRTAFFTFIYTKSKKGKFILRIDDTDEERNKREFESKILYVLKKINVYPDFKFKQSENLSIYKNFIIKLLNEDKAYKCYCTKDRLESLKKKQIIKKQKIGYDNFCRYNVPIKSNHFVVRLKVSYNNKISFNDKIGSKFTIDTNLLDDFIICKNNYHPTYNFASIVDDYVYNITDVIRGNDHVLNTFRQILIFKSLTKKSLPNFLHLPMILNSKKQILSKRCSKSSIEHYLKDGILANPFNNYLIRLGWACGNKEIYSFKEMLVLFNILSTSKSPSIFDKEKLIWFNKYYLKNNRSSYIKKQIYLLTNDKIFNLDIDYKLLIDLLKNRYYSLKLIIDKINEINFSLSDTNPSKNKCFYSSKSLIKFLNDFYSSLFKLNTWNLLSLKNILNEILKRNRLYLKDVAIFLRIILSGENNNIPIYNMLYICGKVLILKKIRIIIKRGYNSNG